MLTHRPPTDPAPFVGRERELAELRRALQAGRSGHGEFVLLRADAGMGKTRLCEEASRFADELGFTCLSGHCLEGGVTVAYLPFVELLEAAALQLPPDLLRAALANVGPELTSLAPQLRAVLPAEISARGDLTGDHRHALFAALRDFLDRLSRAQPLLLVIEDVHWADASTTLLLRQLVRFVAARRMVILATCRPSEPDEAESRGVADLLAAELHRQRSGSVLQLDELSLDDVMLLIRAITCREPPLSVAQALLARTGGNPLFVEQVVKHLSEDGRVLDERGRWVELTSLDELPIPESVRIAIERRLRYVDEDCRRLLTTAAVGARRIDYELLSTVTDLDPQAFLIAVENAEHARLVTLERSGGRLYVAFSHDLIRHVLLQAVSQPRRERLHLQIAQAIERFFDNAQGERDADLAHHYLQAGSTADASKTLRYVTAAAERAIASTAYEEAARMYTAALGLVSPSDASSRCELLLRRGEARKRVSDSDEARDAFAAAAEIARETGEWRQLARAALGYARSWPTVGSVDSDAVALLSAALDAVPDGERALRARLMSRHALQMLYCGSPDVVTSLARDAVDASRLSGDAMTLARALQVLHAGLWQPAHLSERLALGTEIVDLSGELSDQGVALWGRRPLIADLMELGELPAAEAEIDVYERGASATRQPIYLWQAAVRRAMIAVFHGRLDEGERLAQRALDLGRQAEGQNLMAAFGGQLLVIRWLQGRVTELKPLIAASRENQPGVKLWAAVLAFIEAEAGNPANARAQFEELAADRFAALPDEDTRLVVIALASLTCAALGDGIRAEQLYELLLPYDGRNIVVSEGVACVGAAAHYLGILAATARRRNDAQRHFDDAIAFNTATGGRPWLAQTQYEYARMLLARRDAGDRRRASDLLRAALGIARDLGMQGLQEKIEHMLRGHRRLTPEDPHGLTRREQEVLRLISRGRSTREISEELVLSQRTSARHITNIYAKIGARNRVEATAFALRHGLAG